MYCSIPSNSQSKIAVVGGGVAGATIALRLSELGIDTTLFEKSEGLVSGPPFCHLHAGGNLYRDISDQQCLALLQQSIDTLKVYRHCVNWRPTVIALPVWDKSAPSSLLPRLEILRDRYTKLVEEDASNQVLGEPSNYFAQYNLDKIKYLAKQAMPSEPKTLDDWMVPLAKHMDFSKIQFPIFLVQEYGLSAFRFSATAKNAMDKITNCTLKLQHSVKNVQQISSNRWEITCKNSFGQNEKTEFDYIVNACGFRSGLLDDMLGLPRKRMVEFKSAYVAKWEQTAGHWPEVIFHGLRGTPQGMAQLTPYKEGYFQLHGMTEVITLFKDGLAASNENSAQPNLADHHLSKIEDDWHQSEVESRTRAAITHIAQFIPQFNSAALGAKPLYGAQQIPGDDPSLRASDVSFHGDNYARAEIVKASSSLAAADAILQKLIDVGLATNPIQKEYAKEHYFPVTKQCSADLISEQAELIAKKRGYPAALAKQIYTDIGRTSRISEKLSNVQFGS